MSITRMAFQSTIARPALILLGLSLTFAVAPRRAFGQGESDEAHRAGGYGMRAPELRLLPPGGFAEWMRRRGRLGGQNKVPRVISDPELFADLQNFASQNKTHE